MKSFWRVRNDKDTRLYLEFINVSKSYIEILLDPANDPNKYCFSRNEEYILISYDDVYDNNPILNSFGWGWGTEYDYDFFIKNDFIYQGIVTLRKNKLKKINSLCGG